MTDADETAAPSPTAPPRSTSGKAELQRRIAGFIAQAPTSAGWTPEGFRPDLDLLSRILALTDPTDIRGGSVAAGLDLWAAAMLRAAGLGGVKPGESEPFYVGALATSTQPTFELIDQALRGLQAVEKSLHTTSPNDARELRKASLQVTRQLRRLRSEVERGTTSVLGESRRKQVDVFMAEWDRGLELLISTKTFALAAKLSDLVKNLPNRWEEFDGDLKNLRGRFPLAVIGALTVLPAMAVQQNALPAFVDMMTKLTAPGRPWVNAYDRAAIIVADWDHATADFVPLLNDQLDESKLPSELQPAEFFGPLLSRLFQRAPVSEHVLAREAEAAAKGESTEVISKSVEAIAEALNNSGEDRGT